MTFLNPAWLWGLTALAVPIIVHFFNLRRPKQILFSNVAFVKEVKQTVVRRVKFQRWILLLLRMLAIACVVFAFARPVIQQEGQSIVQGNRSVVIVLDNSFSMQGGNEKGGYDQQALSLARNIVKAFSKQDEFLVMGTNKLLLNTNFSAQSDALLALQELEIQQHVTTHTDILNLTSDLFGRASYGSRELYFISDFQRSTVMPDSQQLVLLDSNIQVSYIPLSTRSQQNVYLKSHRITSTILQADQPIELALTLVNDGDQALNDLSVRFVVEGEVVAINNTNLPANGSQELDVTFTVDKPGWNAGYVEIDDNPIDFDNQRFISFYIPDNEKILLLEGQASHNLRILYDILFTSFDATILSARKASSVQLEDYASVVLVGLESLSTGLTERLRSYLTEGGNVLLIPGENMNLTEINGLLGGIGAGAFQAPVTKEIPEKASQVDLAHPVFGGIYAGKGENRQFDAPNIYRYFPFQVDNRNIHNAIIALPSGAPILLEVKLPASILYMLTTFPGDEWTDLQIKSIFAPLFFRITQILTQSQSVSQGQLIGNYSPVKIRTTAETLIQLVDKQQNAITPEQYIRGGSTTLQFDNMDLDPGNYQVVQGDALLEQISFNVSDQESRLDAYRSNALQDKLKQLGLNQIQVLEPEANQVSRLIDQSREGTPLWKYFIIATLLWLILEIVLLRASSIQKRARTNS